MARHVSDLATFTGLMESKGIVQGKNKEMIIDYENSKKEFESRQTLIELLVHAADVST